MRYRSQGLRDTGLFVSRPPSLRGLRGRSGSTRSPCLRSWRNNRMSEQAARERAARLQEQLGRTVQAATSNDWRGAYALVDFDTLESVAEQLRELREVTQRAE